MTTTTIVTTILVVLGVSWGITIWWACECEQDHVGEQDQFFWEYYVDTWHKIFHDVEFFRHVHGWTIIMDEIFKQMKNENGWKMKIDKQKKRMNTTCSQPKVMS